MVIKTGKGKKVGPAASICKHLPLIQAECHGHYKEKPYAPQLVTDKIQAEYPGRKRCAYSPQNPVKGNVKAKQLHIDDPSQIVNRNSCQDIGHKKAVRIIDIRQVAVYQADIIGINHIAGGIFDVP